MGKKSPIKPNAILLLNGKFKDQRGTVQVAHITGHNGNGVPCRQYNWMRPADSNFQNKSFEAFDTQILPAIVPFVGDPKKIVYSVTVADIQAEALSKRGKYLTEDELETFMIRVENDLGMEYGNYTIDRAWDDIDDANDENPNPEGIVDDETEDES